MNFFEKLGKVLLKNIFVTVVLAVAIILFLYFTNFDLIAGLFTTIFAMVAAVCISVIYQEYKQMPVVKDVVAKPVKKAKKSTTKSKKK